MAQRPRRRSTATSPTSSQCAAPDPTGCAPNAPTRQTMSLRQVRRDMQIRTGSTGVFLGCSGYALPPKERCTKTVNLIHGDEAVDVEKDDEGERSCCGPSASARSAATAMDGYLVDEAESCTSAGTTLIATGSQWSPGNSASRDTTVRSSSATSAVPRCSSSPGVSVNISAAPTKTARTRASFYAAAKPAPPKADPVPMPELPLQDGRRPLRAARRRCRDIPGRQRIPEES